MSNNSEIPFDSASGTNELTIANANKDLVRNPLHGLALDLSGTSDRGLNQESVRPQLASVLNNRDNSVFRDSINREEPRISYKKTTEISRILPEFDGKNISINRHKRM